MGVARHGAVSCAMVVAAVCALRCSPAVRSERADASEATLECAAADIHHVFRIRAAEHTVEDLSFSPAKRGVADVSVTGYVLLFDEPRDHYQLILDIDRDTGKGTRRLFDDEQQAIRGHGGTDDIVCTRQSARR